MNNVRIKYNKEDKYYNFLPVNRSNIEKIGLLNAAILAMIYNAFNGMSTELENETKIFDIKISDISEFFKKSESKIQSSLRFLIKNNIIKKVTSFNDREVNTYVLVQ